VRGLARYRVASRSPWEATELGQERQGSPDTMGTRVYPRTLCVPTRPWSADASVGEVRQLPPDIASLVGILSGLFQTADVPGLTWPESPTATSTLPVGHRQHAICGCCQFDIRQQTQWLLHLLTRSSLGSRFHLPSSPIAEGNLWEVVEALYKRLGMAYLKTSTYGPQTDAKCEQVHFSVHNLITKLWVTNTSGGQTY